VVKRFVFGGRWPGAVPQDLRPLRTVQCTPLDDAGPGTGFAVGWFADRDALARYDAWNGEDGGTAFVDAEEQVMRGGDWLDRRWADGGLKWKHVALARRANGLSVDEFSAQWKGHAGTAAGGGGATVAIPEAARGKAYVQNHPLPRGEGEWAWDAITEVWFDDPGAMQARQDWFAANPQTGGLFRDSIFLSVTEELTG